MFGLFLEGMGAVPRAATETRLDRQREAAVVVAREESILEDTVVVVEESIFLGLSVSTMRTASRSD